VALIILSYDKQLGSFFSYIRWYQIRKNWIAWWFTI